MPTESLALADAVRYHMSTPENPLDIGVLLVLDDVMSEADLRRLSTERLSTHARFRQTVAKAHFPRRLKWRAESAFDPREHIVVHPEILLSERVLAVRVGERLSAPLSFERSPWELERFTLVPGRSALLFRVHHCIADGLALVRLLCEIADAPRPSAPRRTPSTPRSARIPLPTPRSALNKARVLANTLVGLSTALPDASHELHDPCGRKSVAWSEPFGLGALREAARAYGHHVTELLLAATATALGRGLRATGYPVPGTLRVLVPFGASLGRQELGNHFASTFVDLVLDASESRECIERIAAHTEKLHDPAEAGAARALIGMAGWLSPPLMRGALDFFSRRASLMLSNVPGPSEPVHLVGHRVRSVVVFAPPASSIGLSFTLFGYAGDMRLGVEVDDSLPLAPSQLVTDFESVIREFTQIAPAS